MRSLARTILVVLPFVVQTAFCDDAAKLLTIDHYVRVKSTVPAIAGQTAQVYVRELVLGGTGLREGVTNDRIVLFVHGAGTPAEVSFDVPFQDFSWMRYLAGAGFDVFAMDETGYGRSTRPAPMNDPCKLSRDQQAAFVPSLLSAPCSPSYPHQLTTIASDWNDIDAVVDHLRVLRHVERVSMISWPLRRSGPAKALPTWRLDCTPAPTARGTALFRDAARRSHPRAGRRATTKSC